MSQAVAILGTRYPDLSVEKEVLGDDTTLTTATGASRDEIVEAAREADVIIAGSLPKFDREVLSRLPACRGIVRAGIGVDSIDLDVARSAGLWVANVPDYGTESVAQHTLAMALAATRRLLPADQTVRAGEWDLDHLRPLHLPEGMTVGIVGYGRIGRRVAELFRAVGFGELLVHDPHQESDQAGVKDRTLDVLLSESQLVSLHAPGQVGDRPLLGSREIGLMTRESILVNTSRGSLVDMRALAEAMRMGAPYLAALDVYEEEPPDLRLFAGMEQRLLLTPHMAWYTEESQVELRRKAAEAARCILEGSQPANTLVVPEDLV